jgi:hypothetical protein
VRQKPNVRRSPDGYKINPLRSASLSIIPFTILAFILAGKLDAQIINYDKSGTYMRSSGESISVVVAKKANSTNKALIGPVSFPGVIGSVIGLGVDIGKAILTSQQKKYTATYTASKSESELIYFHSAGNSSTADLNIDNIAVTRSFLDDNGKFVEACHFSLEAEKQANSGLFRFKLDTLSLSYTKAKIKKGGKMGKRVDMQITLKLDALWQDAINTSNIDSNKRATSQQQVATKDLNSFQIKSATLGESTILIPAVAPEGPIKLNDSYYSGWYQLLPSTALKYADAENNWKVGNYIITITVKEANPYSISATAISDFFNSSGNDIGTLLKQFFTDSTKKN